RSPPKPADGGAKPAGYTSTARKRAFSDIDLALWMGDTGIARAWSARRARSGSVRGGLSLRRPVMWMGRPRRVHRRASARRPFVLRIRRDPRLDGALARRSPSLSCRPHRRSGLLGKSDPRGLPSALSFRPLRASPRQG